MDQVRSRWVLLALALLIIGSVLRLIHLGADPAYDLWAGYVTDEGRWTEQARQLVLFGDIGPRSGIARMHLMLAPLYQAVSVVPFTFFGVGIVQARTVSAASGILLMVFGLLLLRRHFAGPALAATMAVLALQPDLLLLSRVAIPEIAALLFSFLAFMTLVAGTGSHRRLMGAGLLTLVAIGFKGTTAPLIPLFAVVAWALARESGAGRGWRAAGAFFAGSLAPAALAAVAGLAVGGAGAASRLLGTVPFIIDFVELDSGYGAASWWLYRGPAVVTLLMVLWILAALLWGTGGASRGPVRRIWLGSGIWVIGWLLCDMVLAYFPDRYVFHVLVPVVLNIGAGLTLLGEMQPGELSERLRAVDGRRRALLAAWLAVPLAVLVAQPLLVIGQAVGLDLDRLRDHLLLAVLLETGLALAAARYWRPHLHLQLLVAFPLFAVALGTAIEGLGLADVIFWDRGDPLPWMVAFTVAGLCVLALRRLPAQPHVAAGVAFGVLVPIGWGASATPKVVAPTYTLSSATAAVEALSEPDELIGAIKSAGILVGTRLRYVETVGYGPPPDMLVVAFQPLAPSLAGDYALERVIDVELGDHPSAGEPDASTVRIYRRVERRTRPERSGWETRDQPIVDRADDPPDRVSDDEHVDEADEATYERN